MGKFGALLTVAALATGCVSEEQTATPPQQPHPPSLIEGLDTAIERTCLKYGSELMDRLNASAITDNNVADRAVMSSSSDATLACLAVGQECAQVGDMDRATVLAGITNVDSWVEDLSVRVGNETAIACMAAAGYEVEPPSNE